MGILDHEIVKSFLSVSVNNHNFKISGIFESEILNKRGLK